MSVLPADGGFEWILMVVEGLVLSSAAFLKFSLIFDKEINRAKGLLIRLSLSF